MVSKNKTGRRNFLKFLTAIPPAVIAQKVVPASTPAPKVQPQMVQPVRVPLGVTSNPTVAWGGTAFAWVIPDHVYHPSQVWVREDVE